jgi:hypothetical protein
MSATTTDPKPINLANFRDPNPGAPRRPSALQAAVAPEATLPIIAPGLASLQGYELLRRISTDLANSTLVPESFRLFIPSRYTPDKSKENPSAISNCMIALRLAEAMRIDPLLVMQNLYIVEGKPGWSAPFVIARFHESSVFKRLRYDFHDRGEKTVEYETWEWSDAERQKVPRLCRVKIHGYACTAWAVLRETGERIEGLEVSVEMAVKEGWYTKRGSKWRTIPRLMLQYRAATFFVRLHCPEILMGTQTADEVADALDAEQTKDGSWQVVEPQPDVIVVDAPATGAETGAATAGTKVADKPADAPQATTATDTNPGDQPILPLRGGRRRSEPAHSGPPDDLPPVDAYHMT